MTAQVIPVMDESISSNSAAQRPHTIPSLPRLWASTLFVYIFPRRCGKLWLDASLPRAGIIAALNAIGGLATLFLVLVAERLWNPWGSSSSILPTSIGWHRIRTVSRAIPFQIADFIHDLPLLERAVGTIALLAMVVLALALPFFVLLPFAARPGPARPCVRHVARTVLLATGGLYLWGIALIAIFLRLAVTLRPNNGFDSEWERAITPVLLAGTTLGIWTLASLIAAIRLDYRTPADQPQPHDPWCDDCGYNLIAADPAGRCPECGRLVSDSLGSHTRLPTLWERNPKASNFPVIIQQLNLLVRHPRRLFLSMPTLNGQRAAQRWLLFSMLVIAAAALLIVPTIVVTGGILWSAEVLSGSLAMAFIWALLATMMVGIETAGVATVSRMRANREGPAGNGRGVYLAAAAKVTCYSSILMVAWVFLGGTQLIFAVHYFFNESHMPVLSIHTQQILLASSLSIAHIGGLLWYEFTVYRGIRAVQFANK